MKRLNEALITHAIFSEEIRPVFQPVVNVATGEIIGAEVLARWTTADKSEIPPKVFIPKAMVYGQIVALTLGLMKQVTRLLHAMNLPQGKTLTIGFNAEQACLKSKTFESASQNFMMSLSGAGIQLAVEVTEREPVGTSAVLCLERLRDKGASIVLDDYGTCFSNAAAIKSIQPDIVKIDRSLTMLAGSGDPQGYLTECLLNLAFRKNIQVLAEGVETQKELEWFKKFGINLMQGWLFERPMEWAALQKKLYEVK